MNTELPKDWKKATIKECISSDGVFVDGDWIESKDQDPNGEVRLIQLADIGDGYFKNKSSRYLTLKRAKELNCTFLSQGDVLVARMPDPIGRTCIFPLKGGNKYVTAVDVAIIRPGKGSANNKYLSFAINSLSIRNEIEELQSGTTRKRISRANLATIKLPLPPLPEQHRIVAKLEELLSELEKGKEQLHTALDQLKVYRQAVLKYAFEGKLTNKNVKDGELLKGWKWEPLGEIMLNYDGKRVPLSRKVREKRKGKYRYYGATEIVDYIDDFLFDGEYLLIGEDGANLVSKSRPLAFIVEGKFWVNNHAHILQAKGNISLKYVCNYFNSLNLAQYVTGSAQPKLTQANMNKISIPFCPPEEQHRIVEEIESRLSIADKLEETITESLQQSETLRQSILKKAFEGKLV
jgi:type I restriction enzyme S subunit